MSRKIVSQIAYLIGVRTIHLPQFDDDIIQQLERNSNCTLIRRLCRLRNILLTHYNEIERELKKYDGRISLSEKCKHLYDSLINYHGIDIEKSDFNTINYIESVNAEIENNIDSLSPLFLTSKHNEIWKYIRKMFIFPNDIISERRKFIEGREFYPFSCYISWQPEKAGNILENDAKFLSILFFNNGVRYEAPQEELVTDIYQFANKCKRVIIAVDCENVDYSAFYTALYQFKSELLNRIEQVILFDDRKLMSEWNYYNINLPIKFQRIDCPRIQNNKSTLDVKMSAYITAAHYRDGIDGFILVSSDSDYWGVIDTIGSTAKFFIMGEKRKMSTKNLAAFDDKRISYSMLDDFSNDKISDRIKKETYTAEIKDVLDGSKFSITYFLNLLQNQTMYLSDEDKNIFRSVICNLIIKFDEKGNALYSL